MFFTTERERGAAFEVFVEAYLSTDEIAQAEEVGVGGKVPAEVRRRLNLPARDYGYHGVYRTRLDELVAYQAKFRSARTSLPYAELATGLGSTTLLAALLPSGVNSHIPRRAARLM